jgi:Ser/Thr protein kinase RdoA (MazF antagonist)
VLVHNDFADWNLLTDGNDVTGILDWDECVAGDAVSDIACWSTFFEPERLQGFLDGYWQVAEKPADFDDKFELLRLRYVLSKMTLRIRRYSWEPSDFMKDKIETGKTHLAQSMEYFKI